MITLLGMYGVCKVWPSSWNATQTLTQMISFACRCHSLKPWNQVKQVSAKAVTFRDMCLTPTGFWKMKCPLKKNHVFTHIAAGCCSTMFHKSRCVVCTVETNPWQKMVESFADDQMTIQGKSPMFHNRTFIQNATLLALRNTLKNGCSQSQ